MATPDDFASFLEELARRFWGEPNPRLSKPGVELRWGDRGRRSVDLVKGVWCDHAVSGGGTIDFVMREAHCATKQEAVAWLVREGYLKDTSSKIVAEYPYCDESGKCLFQVCRFQPKRFAQRQPKPGGGWIWHIRGVRRVLFRLPELIAAVKTGRTIYVVEGEKDVLSLTRVGLAATCNPMGAGHGKWRREYSEFLANADVIIIPDVDAQSTNDKGELQFHPDGRPVFPGQDYAQTIARSLAGVAKRVRVLDLSKHWPECPPKGDVSDWLAAGGTADKLREFADATPDWQPQGMPPVNDASDDGRPVIRLASGKIHEVVTQAEAALIAAKVDVYQRGSLIMRPVRTKMRASKDRETLAWRLVPVRESYLVDLFTRLARFEKFDIRQKEHLPKDCPRDVAGIYLAREGAWNLPILLGVINAPFLRADGSICDQPGYDPPSGLLFRPDGHSFPSIAPCPTRQDAAEALAYLVRLIDTFPFVSPADRSVALSAILTAMDRRSMATAPLHAFTARVAGTGKSLLVDIVAMIATGQLAPSTGQAQHAEELEKRLGTALIAGDAIINIDNCDFVLESPFLCTALTQQSLKIRWLGRMQDVEVLPNSTFFAGGNNLGVAGDLIRRTLLCSMDARCERPELRKFSVDPLEVARADRGKLLAAVLTILRAWHVARVRLGVTPLGSFEEWSHRIREPLLWLGHPDPCDTMITLRENDPKRSGLNAVLVQWKETLGLWQSYTVQEVISRATGVGGADLQVALLGVAANNRGLVSNDRLGRWLARNEGAIVNGLALAKDGSKHGYALWKLVKY